MLSKNRLGLTVEYRLRAESIFAPGYVILSENLVKPTVRIWTRLSITLRFHCTKRTRKHFLNWLSSVCTSSTGSIEKYMSSSSFISADSQRCFAAEKSFKTTETKKLYLNTVGTLVTDYRRLLSRSTLLFPFHTRADRISAHPRCVRFIFTH